MNDLHEVPEEDARAITAAMVVLGALGFVAGIVVLMQTTSQGKPDWLSWILDNYMLTIGAVATGLFALGAYAFKTKRIYGYALLTLVIFVAGHFINFPLYY